MKEYKQGYTQGVFDLFHVGHLNLINQSKKQCNTLIVGVNTDILTYERKNKFPIIPNNDRLSIVCSIKGVDKALLIHDPDHYNNILTLGCDVLFVGDDWKGSEKFSLLEEKLAKKGIDVVYIPYTKNISSSILRDFI